MEPKHCKEHGEFPKECARCPHCKPCKWTPDGRPFSAADRYHLYLIGWRDGAGMKAIRHHGYPDYDKGYEEGRHALSAAGAAASKRTRYKPSILRLAKA
jgi:hypothetical protein